MPIEDWVNVNTSLPSRGVRVFVFVQFNVGPDSHRMRSIGVWNGEKWIIVSLGQALLDGDKIVDGTVVRWMPLPDPPRDVTAWTA